MNFLTAAGFGFFGGVVRGLVGLMKLNRFTLTFRWKYFAFTVVVSAIIGMFAGMLVNADYRVSMLAGYAGIDLIEGMYKAFLRKK